MCYTFAIKTNILGELQMSFKKFIKSIEKSTSTRTGQRWHNFDMLKKVNEDGYFEEGYFKDCYVSPQFNDFSTIHVKANNAQQIYLVYKNSEIAGPFDYASLFRDGFVEIHSSKGQVVEYVDMLGRIAPEMTKSGTDFYKYSRGLISIADLDAQYFADDIFYNGVIDLARQKFAKQLQDRYGLKDEISPYEFARASIEVQIIEDKREQASALNTNEQKESSVAELSKKEKELDDKIIVEREEKEKAEQEQAKIKEKIKVTETNKILDMFDNAMIR